jgi:hypothetical protein
MILPRCTARGYIYMYIYTVYDYIYMIIYVFQLALWLWSKNSRWGTNQLVSRGSGATLYQMKLYWHLQQFFCLSQKKWHLEFPIIILSLSTWHNMALFVDPILRQTHINWMILARLVSWWVSNGRSVIVTLFGKTGLHVIQLAIAIQTIPKFAQHPKVLVTCR